VGSEKWDVMEVESHPFEPFLPEDARLLMLGTFPPSEKRWSVKFYYPNFINDMWRIVGLLFFHNKDYFVDAAQKRFRLDLLIPFLKAHRIALFDTATRIRRITGTASDKDLEVVEETDLHQMLRRLPCCESVVTAGQLATEIACSQFGVIPPKVGESVPFNFEGRQLRLYRMPSSSRAYPMKLEQKAAYYQKVLLP
jgi:G:T/U-mismatch repair DNA glycosylase